MNKERPAEISKPTSERQRELVEKQKAKSAEIVNTIANLDLGQSVLVSTDEREESPSIEARVILATRDWATLEVQTSEGEVLVGKKIKNIKVNNDKPKLSKEQYDELIINRR